MDLLFTELDSRLVLVETRQIAIVPFVQGLIPNRFESGLTNFLKNERAGVLGARERRSEGDIKMQTE